ncbi:ribose-phosphate diphosphokinase [Defluviimonas salinarum]|uniref:Ribose-phosphate diphosphokinase n=1 Tax=Defluviimonas salinarum TaxID=2992147 RepID=A0ABT3J5D6_9RHOB|nr:ribose-phosphate diphosphokinase [Defluviimonas salinarum]MCW3782880.1 ribose-phosphate diphosphokinase [Defluviimonas salinarum]
MILIPFPEMMPMAREIAAILGAEVQPVALHRFPDAETRVTLGGDPGGHDVAVLATLRDPDRLALPLRFTAATAREIGARRVGLIAPYLAYMRQDARFHECEAVSAPIFARFLAESFDWIVTADPHLHRNPTLDTLFPIPAQTVATAPLLASWIAANVPDAVILGPDSESQQWVAEVARHAARPYAVLRKIRTGDRQVEIGIPDSPALRSGTPVILDDITSSGRTLVRTLERLKEVGARSATCVVIHAVFSGAAEADIGRAGAARIVTTDSIPHPTNAIGIAALLAGAVADLSRALDGPVTGSTTLDGNSSKGHRND